MNNKGVSLVALVVTMIVIIIIAGIVISSGIGNISTSQKGAFMVDLENMNTSLQKYNTRAVLYNHLPGEYYDDELQWDGKTERAEHTARMEVSGEEDTALYIFDNNIPNTLKGKIKIIDGKLYVDRSYQQEFEWAAEQYKYMSGDGKN